MNFWKIKWENIFTIITGSILLSMTIKFIVINGFNLDLVYVVLLMLGVRWCIKMTRKFYLAN